MVSYWCSIVTLSLSALEALRDALYKYSTTTTTTKMHHFWDTRLWKMLWPWNPGQRSLKVIKSGTIRYISYGILLVFYSNFIPMMHRFWDIRLVSIPWPWNPGQWSLKVIGIDTGRSATYDFLLKLHSNIGLSCTVLDFSRKTQNWQCACALPRDRNVVGEQ